MFQWLLLCPLKRNSTPPANLSATARPDHERKLQLDGTEKSGIQKTLDCDGNLWNLRSSPGQCGDLDDKSFYGIAFFHFPPVNGGVVASPCAGTCWPC